MLTDNVVLQVLKSGTLSDTESLIGPIPRKTYQSLILLISLSQAQAASIQLLFKNDPVGAAPNAATQLLRVAYKLNSITGAKVSADTVVTDANGMVAIPITDACQIEVALPPMLMARSDAFTVGVKAAAAPTGTSTYTALLAQSRA